MIAEHELAAPRTFRTVCGALRWWRLEHARRLSMACLLASCPSFPERRARTAATFALLTACMAGISRRRIAALCVWYDSETEPSPPFARYCKRTRSLLRRRMLARGLLAD